MGAERGPSGLLEELVLGRFWEEPALFPPLPGTCALRLPHPVPSALRRFDIYRKVPKDLTQPTYTGAISE